MIFAQQVMLPVVLLLICNILVHLIVPLYKFVVGHDLI